ncbi:MAG: hypothetical protein Q4D38_10425, partial [Planctomycetia bacterium]|nr:hypothetical protein [Planctomycetia bacterium]
MGNFDAKYYKPPNIEKTMKLIRELIDYCQCKYLLTSEQIEQLQQMGLLQEEWEDDYRSGCWYNDCCGGCSHYDLCYRDIVEQDETDIFEQKHGRASRKRGSGEPSKTITAPQLDTSLEDGLKSLFAEPAVTRTVAKISEEADISHQSVSEGIVRLNALPEDEMRKALAAALGRPGKGHLTLNDVYAVYLAFPDMSFLETHCGPAVQAFRKIFLTDNHSLTSSKYRWILKQPNIKALYGFNLFRYHLMDAVAHVWRTDEALFERWSSDFGRLRIHNWSYAVQRDTMSLKVWMCLTKSPISMTCAGFERLLEPDVVACVLYLDPSRLTDYSNITITGGDSSEQEKICTQMVFDENVVALPHFVDVNRLDFFRARITDAGLAHLAGLTNLESLDLGWTKITDAGLAHLAGLTNLDWLELRDTNITDPGLAHLAGLTNLNQLGLENTNITDAGLAHLAGLTNLDWLELRDT